MSLDHLKIALERAANEGRNVLPDASDDEARLIESLAAHLLIAVALDIVAAEEAATIAEATDDLYRQRGF